MLLFFGQYIGDHLRSPTPMPNEQYPDASRIMNYGSGRPRSDLLQFCKPGSLNVFFV